MLIMTMFLEDIKDMQLRWRQKLLNVNVNQFFKQDLIWCSEGNECEPLDINFSSDIVISHSVMISNLPEPAMETGMTVETGIAVIYDENLEVANVQRNDDFTIPNPSHSYPDDLDLTEEKFILVCKECMKSIKITEDGINTVEEKKQGGNQQLRVV